MPTKKLPASPNLNHLKDQARDLIADRQAGSPPALQRIREFHPKLAGASNSEVSAAKFTLADAQWTIAREYGFASWTRLKAFVETAPVGELDRLLEERIKDPIFREALGRLDAGDLDGLKRIMDEHSDLVHRRVEFEGGNYFRNPSLLEFTAENPVRKGSLPENIVELMALILEAGGGDSNETLGLVCSGRVSRESGRQAAMIKLLCRHGADPNAAMPATLGHGEFAAAEELLRHGATLDLAAAAAMGRVDDAIRLLPTADAGQRHAGLAYATMFSELEIVRMLLEEGEDPNRFNPVGIHSHSTPLHQAATCGDPEMVMLLLSFGARADIRDTVWGGTAIDWAEHGEQSEIVDLIKAHLGAQGHE